jgi:hypothetical protein
MKKKSTYIYNCPEIWVANKQVAYVFDSGSDNCGLTKLSESEMFKQTPELLQQLVQRASSKKEITSSLTSPLNITELEPWIVQNILLIDESFKVHSAFRTTANGVRIYDAEIPKILSSGANREQNQTYILIIADKSVRDVCLYFWAMNRAFKMKISENAPLRWKHLSPRMIVNPLLKLESINTHSQAHTIGGQVVIVMASLAIEEGPTIWLPPSLSPHTITYTVEKNACAYLHHIVTNYDFLNEMTVFVIRDCSAYLNSPADEIIKVVDNAFAQGYAEIDVFMDCVVRESDVCSEKEFYHELFGEKMSTETFSSPIFAVRKDHILSRSVEFYTNVLTNIKNHSEKSFWINKFWRKMFTSVY